MGDIWSAGCVTLMILTPVLWILKWLGLRSWFPIAACGALVAGIWSGVHMRRTRRRWSTESATYREFLEDGVAEDVTFDVVDAIEIEEDEDLGSNYYLKLANNQVLFLSGQYLYDPEEEKQFPSTRVRRTVVPRSGLLLEFECLGTYFPPSSSRPSFTEQEYESGRVPDDGAVSDDDFESLRRP